MKILVVAAHTDDEALGCGGTLRRHADDGDEVYAIHLTNGVGARLEVAEGALKERSSAAQQAAEVLGFSWFAGADFPDNGLDTVPFLEIAQFIERVAKSVQPEIVYTHHGGDLNVDHRIAFQATLTAFRPQPGGSVREIRTFEVPSSTEWSHQTIGEHFVPNLVVNIASTWEAKKLALDAYETEMRAFPHSRSLQALEARAILRGSEVGLAKGEAFHVMRRIIE